MFILYGDLSAGWLHVHVFAFSCFCVVVVITDFFHTPTVWRTLRNNHRTSHEVVDKASK